MPCTTPMPWHGVRGRLLRLLFRAAFAACACQGLAGLPPRHRQRLLRLCFRFYLGRDMRAHRRLMRLYA